MRSAEILKSLAEHASFSAVEPYKELVFSGKDLRQAVSTLPSDCRTMLANSTIPMGMITQRNFATVLIDVRLKENISFDVLKIKLLELEELIHSRYHAQIGLERQSGRRRLELTSSSIRFVSFQTTSIQDLKIRHKDWFK
jgi:hypothetical protein